MVDSKENHKFYLGVKGLIKLPQAQSPESTITQLSHPLHFNKVYEIN